MPVNRKLVAVVMADVVGYSRLMERDEAGTHQRLRALHDELIAPKIAEHGGRTVRTAGDGMLLEFPSATSALRCAVEIQREMAIRNVDVAPEVRIVYRIGINLGDIIVDGADIIGDGVNIAARLEALAEPGGICVASAIWEQVHEDLGVDFVDGGEQQVKNISKPIHVYRVALAKGPAPTRSRSAAVVRSKAWRPARRAAVAALAAVVVLAAALAALWPTLRPVARSPLSAEAVPLRSVMILPFVAAPDDPALAAKATQLTADVTRAVGDSMREMRVVSARAAETYAGRIGEAVVVGREAKVRFVVEGDLRPAGPQVALTLRLVDTRDGRQLENARKVVDRQHLGDGETLARQLAAATRMMLSGAVVREVTAPGSKAASAHDFVDRALAVSLPDPVARAREMRRFADAAIKLDPNLARAWTARTNATVDLYFYDFSVDTAPLIAEADADSLRAVTLDPMDAGAWLARGQALRMRANMKAALAAIDRAQELDPTRLAALFVRGFAYLDAGKPEETLKVMATLRGTVGGIDAYVAMQTCVAHLLLGAYAEAIAECERVETSWLIWQLHANLAAAYAMHGDAAKAAQAKGRLLEAVPGFTISRFEGRFFPHSTAESIALDRAHFIPGLRKAGVPE